MTRVWLEGLEHRQVLRTSSPQAQSDQASLEEHGGSHPHSSSQALQHYHQHSLTSTTKDILQNKPACYIHAPCKTTALSFQGDSTAFLVLSMHGEDFFSRHMKVYEYPP